MTPTEFSRLVNGLLVAAEHAANDNVRIALEEIRRGADRCRNEEDVREVTNAVIHLSGYIEDERREQARKETHHAIEAAMARGRR